jgi:hypothetical protein
MAGGWFDRMARRAGLGFALLVPASAAAALALHAFRAWEVPTREEWERAARVVRDAFRPGDLVAFAPGWAQEGRGLFEGLDVLPQERWTQADVARARRLFVVASFGAEPPEWLGRVADFEETIELGRMRVFRVRIRGAGARLDLVAHTGLATVTLAFPGRTISCPRAGERHDCTEGRTPWRWVAEHRLRVGGSLRRCVWAHPTTGAALRIEYPPVPLGRALSVSHGLSDEVAGRGAPVTLEVWVGGERAARITHAPDPGWRETRIDTARFQGRVEPVAFVVGTEHDGARHFCFAAEVTD